jgi:hypothetical protein
MPKNEKAEKKEMSNLKTRKTIPDFLLLRATRKQETNPEKKLSSYSDEIQAIKLKIFLI